MRQLRREMLRIIAPILGVDFAELEQREARRLRFRVAAALCLTLVIAMAVLGIWYHGQTNTRKQAEIAEAQTRMARSTSLSDLARTLLEKDLSLSLLLSVEANLSAHTVQSTSSLLDGLQRANGMKAILREHGNSVEAMAFSPGGERLVSAASDFKLIVWNTRTCQVHRLLSEESKKLEWPEWAIAFTPISSVMASARSDGFKTAKVALWDVQSWNLISEHSLGFGGSVSDLAFNQTGSRLLTLSGGLVGLWEIPNLTLLNLDSARGHFLLTDRQGGMISLLRSGAMSVWTGEGFESEDTLSRALAEDENENIRSAAIAPAGDRLALGLFSCKAEDTDGKETGCVRIWNLSTHEFIGDLLGDERFPPEFLAFNSDETILAASQRGLSKVSLWDLETGIAREIAVADGTVTSLAFSPVKDTLAVGTNAGTIALWEEPGRPALGRRMNQTGEVGWGAAISPDGKIVAAGSRNSTLVLWDMTNNRLIHETFSGHERAVKSVVFSHGSDRMVSVGEDGVLILRDAARAKPIGVPIYTGTTDVAAIALSDNGSNVAWWHGSYEELNILDLATGEGAIAELPTGSGLDAVQLQFVDEDRKILIATRDCRLVEWDIQSKSLRTLVNIEPPEDCSCVAEDARLGLVAFGLEDGNIELWDSASRRRLGRLSHGHRDKVRTLAFSNGRESLLSGDGSDIVLWDLDMGFWEMRACEIANRNFSEAEWRTYFPNEPYRETCGSWGAFVLPISVKPPVIETKPIRPSEVQ